MVDTERMFPLLQITNIELEKRICAAKLIIGLHGAPKMCSQCKWEESNFFCPILNIPSGNDKRLDNCPYTVFEGKA